MHNYLKFLFIWLNKVYIPDAYLELCRLSKMELFVNIVNGYCFLEKYYLRCLTGFEFFSVVATREIHVAKNK